MSLYIKDIIMCHMIMSLFIKDIINIDIGFFVYAKSVSKCLKKMKMCDF